MDDSSKPLHRQLSPSSCTFNAHGTAFMAATRRGVLARALASSATQAPPPPPPLHGSFFEGGMYSGAVSGVGRQQETLSRPIPRPQPPGGSAAATSSDSEGEKDEDRDDDYGADLHLWSAHLPVEAVAQAGTSRVVAVLLGERPASPTAQLPSVVEAAAGTSPPPPLSGASPLASSSARKFVLLFDAKTGTFLAELYFRGEIVQAIRANTHVLVAITVDAFHVVDLQTLQHIRRQTTYSPLNVKSILALSEGIFTAGGSDAEDGSVPAPSITEAAHASTPFSRIAYVQCDEGRGGVVVLTIFPQTLVDGLEKGSGDGTGAVAAAGGAVYTQEQLAVPAHRHAVAALALSPEGGQRLATASERGSCVKLFDTANGALLAQFHRGHTLASIVALALSANGTLCAAMSSHHTLHLFRGPASSSHGGAKEKQRVAAGPLSWATEKLSFPGKPDGEAGSRAILRFRVSPLFTRQDGVGVSVETADATGQTAYAAATTACIAFSSSGGGRHHVWVGQHGVAQLRTGEQAFSRTTGEADIPQLHPLTPFSSSHGEVERCTLQRFDLDISRGASFASPVNDTNTFDELDIVL